MVAILDELSAAAAVVGVDVVIRLAQCLQTVIDFWSTESKHCFGFDCRLKCCENSSAVKHFSQTNCLLFGVRFDTRLDTDCDVL
jgi:hypothetical protein